MNWKLRVALAEGDRFRHGLGTALDHDIDLVAGLLLAKDGADIVGRGHRLAVEHGDGVARLESGLIRRAIFGEFFERRIM